MAEQITYRLAEDSDIDRINNFYNEIYKKHRTYDQFFWEYNSAPAGRALYVIAELNGNVVGTQCAIPYYVITKSNEQILTAKSEDTLVSPNHRGKSIFENMYTLLIEACRNNNIEFIWGFTYAHKPFKKIGFEIPYKSVMGLLTIKPFKAANYFYSITAKKNFSSYSKILVLSIMSSFKYNLLVLKKKKRLVLNMDNVDLNTKDFNYLKYDGSFGLKLDREFIDYRIDGNPYSSNYQSINYFESGVLKASLKYNITKDNIGFIIHLYVASDLSEEIQRSFVMQVIKESSLKKCTVIRYWGFEHNQQNRDEVYLLKKCNFVFVPRGISFVGLNLSTKNNINFSNFVLSRMASQGTD